MPDPIFIQGMRRSGTTILYDLISADPLLRCFYEPLAAGRPAIGGGSGLRDIDLFADVRDAREEFAALHPELEDTSLLNYGAPRDWRLEFERDLPPIVREYLRFLLAQHQAVAMKFTRMSCKIPVLAEIAPQAKLIHVVRDPRAVAVSYLFGKHHRRREQMQDPDAFFETTSAWTQWSSFDFSERLRCHDGARALDSCRDFERILLIWLHTFDETRRGGLAAFGDGYLMLRHEDLQSDPAGAVRRVYDFLRRPLPREVVDLAERVVRPQQTIVAPTDARWREAYERIGMLDSVRAAGYA